MKVGEEHLGDSGGLCTKPISRRGKKKEEKRRQPAWNETSVNSFFPLPSVDIYNASSASLSCTKNETIEKRRVGNFSLPQLSFPSSIFFQSRHQRSICSIDIAKNQMDLYRFVYSRERNAGNVFRFVDIRRALIFGRFSSAFSRDETGLHRALKPWLFRLPNDSIPWFDRSFETKARSSAYCVGMTRVDGDVNGVACSVISHPLRYALSNVPPRVCHVRVSRKEVKK